MAMPDKLEQAEIYVRDGIEIKDSRRERRIAAVLFEKAIAIANEAAALTDEEEKRRGQILRLAYKHFGDVRYAEDQDEEAAALYQRSLEQEDDFDLRKRYAFLLGNMKDRRFKAEYSKLLESHPNDLDIALDYCFSLDLNGHHEEAIERFKSLLLLDLCEAEVERLFSWIDRVQEALGLHNQDFVVDYRQLLESKWPVSQQLAVIPFGIRDISEVRETAPDVSLATVGGLAAEVIAARVRRYPVHAVILLIPLIVLAYPFFVLAIGDEYLRAYNLYYGFMGISITCTYIIAKVRRREAFAAFWLLAMLHFVTYLILAVGYGLPLHTAIEWWVLPIYLIAFVTVHFHLLLSATRQIRDFGQKAVVNRRILYRYFIERAQGLLLLLIYFKALFFLVAFFRSEPYARLAWILNIGFLASAFFFSAFARQFKYKALREELSIVMVFAYIGLYFVNYLGGRDLGEILRMYILETLVLVFLTYSKLFLLDQSSPGNLRLD